MRYYRELGCCQVLLSKVSSRTRLCEVPSISSLCIHDGSSFGCRQAQTSCHVVCKWTAAPRASVAVLPSTRIPGWDLRKEFAIVNYINWILISIASKFTESNLVENKSSSYSQFSLDHTTCCRSSQHRSSTPSPTPGAW